MNVAKIRVCKRCNFEVTTSQVEGYSFSCNECDEDLFEFETEMVFEANSRPRYSVDQRVTVRPDCQDEYYQGLRGQVLLVSHVATSKEQNSLYNDSLAEDGEGLNTLTTLDGQELLHPLYDYELLPATRRMTFEDAKAKPHYKFSQTYSTEQILDFANIPNVQNHNVLAVLEFDGVDIELIVDEVDGKLVTQSNFQQKNPDDNKHWDFIDRTDCSTANFSEEAMFNLLAKQFKDKFEILTVNFNTIHYEGDLL